MTKTQVSNLLQHVDTVARHYDFLPLAEHCVRAADFAPQKSRQQKRTVIPPENTDTRELIRGIHTLYELELSTRRGSHLFYTFTENKTGNITLTFHAIDISHSFADPLLIQITRSLLSLLGYEHRIRINMIGDKDAKKRFSRELGDFFKRSKDDINKDIIRKSTKDVFAAYQALLASEEDVAYICPAPIDHLNEKSRKNLRDILDYLDTSESPYEIDPRLTGDYEYHSGFVFTADVVPTAYNPVVSCAVYGGSYDDYAHDMHDVRHTCASVTFTFTGHIPKELPSSKASANPIALAAIGFAPKLYSHHILDILLHAGVTVHHSPTSLSLSDQLRLAAEKHANIILIVGTHEATRKEIILRNVLTEKQITIPLSKLLKHLVSIAR